MKIVLLEYGDDDLGGSNVIVDLKVRRCETPGIVRNGNSVHEECFGVGKPD